MNTSARFAEPPSEVAGYWGVTKKSTPGVLALRVKVSCGQITETEAVGVRAESSGARFGTFQREVTLIVTVVDNPATGHAPLPETEMVSGSYTTPELIKVGIGGILSDPAEVDKTAEP
ncbi:hypothetical protein DL769_005153 [Monosporascus sp. CRB-8-3]|nr:hypothetical protein DL769_005153 [Monosporascus sp. CRB-8-3]